MGSSPGTPTTKESVEKKKSPTKTPTSSNEEPKAKIILENVDHKDNSFREFRRLCATVSEESSYNSKTEIMQKLFSRGSDGIKFKGNIHLWVRLMLPGVIKRVYNLQSKQLIKIYSRIFEADEDAMLEDLEKGIPIPNSLKQLFIFHLYRAILYVSIISLQHIVLITGDVAETIATFFETSDAIRKLPKSKLTLYDIDTFLTKLSTLTKADEQGAALINISKKCTANDLKMVIRLIKGDLRMNAGRYC